MTEGDAEVDSRMRSPGTDSLDVDGLETYLHCPRRYEFAHVDGLEGSDDGTTIDDRIALLRTAICDALRRGETGREAFADAAGERLEALWADHDERFHSRTQRRHERRVLEATLEAYVETVGVDHAEGVERLTAESTDGELVGPDLPLSSTVSLPATETDTESVTIDASVDYVYADGRSIVGVQFVPTLRSLGLLRYRSDWERGIAERFTDHFDPDAGVFDPSFVASLFETAVVIDGLRTRCQQLGLEDRTCRYVQIPLADRSGTAINWVRETVETSLETKDLTDGYIDHHTYGMTHEHRNRTVDDRLADVVSEIAGDAFDPTDRWDDISSDACPDCGYTVCCQDYIAEEVRFDG
ncbi:PD-(D/E)XK nuclease family protein [Natronorubrum texcoconense]|uniref:PD-(D/E)XK nuclease superfamily protein n=1 Tax=Natronorubrum texcoconense TaxID=1095776 RepID=A0A1G8T3W6_9EURY|nr:PD-(D/E)XK nuclease family protein [Natronorubrum texcoconense]SDJ36258.1 PD-(D/E)XK nuclease superfamily protein [Natronorubrum texcoconense]